MTIAPRRRRGDTCPHPLFDQECRGWDRQNPIDTPPAKNLTVTLLSVVQRELPHFSQIEMTRGVLGGTPRVIGTRIPVSMILDAVRFYGDLAGAIKSYPDLTMDQVKEAVGFSAAVLECRVGAETP